MLEEEILIQIHEICNCMVKPIPGFSGYYITEYGHIYSTRVRRCHRYLGPHLMKPNVSKSGYERVSLCNGKGKVGLFFSHRLVCLAFNGQPPEEKPLALHDDGNSRNNHYSNLYWGDNLDNKQDSIRHGTSRNNLEGNRPFGVENHKSKLDPDKVFEIRNKISGGEKIRAIAREYGVRPYTIRSIRDNRFWKGVGIS